MHGGDHIGEFASVIVHITLCSIKITPCFFRCPLDCWCGVFVRERPFLCQCAVQSWGEEGRFVIQTKRGSV